MLDIRPAGSERLADGGYDFIEGSTSQASLVAQAVRDVQMVDHLAWRCYPSDKRRQTRENLFGMLNPLEAALTAGVRHVLFASSAVVYGPTGPARVSEEHPCHPEGTTVGGPAYGISRLACDKIALVYQRRGLPMSIFRMHGVFSEGRPGQFGSMIQRALAGERVRAIQGAGGE